MKFDETLLRQAYYQTLLPVYQTNTSGNGRADMMRMAQVVANCAPNVLAIPLTAEGKRPFKLVLRWRRRTMSLSTMRTMRVGRYQHTLGIARLIKQRNARAVGHSNCECA